jgi:N-methylhydantoinase A/oxoprolinase/acetone carboxylase beta subunit
MKQNYVIGVDIGGTNTDAVLVDNNEKIIFAAKTTTTDDISISFKSVLKQVLDQGKVQAEAIKGIYLGTTQATNAILQKRDLYRVGLIRIAGHKPNTLPAGFSWPKDLKNIVIAATETIDGGLECHGGELTAFSKEKTCQAIERLIKKNIDSIAIVGVFSPLNGYQENEVASLVHAMYGSDFPISLSHQIGGIGFIERENSTILNAALKRVIQQGFRHLQSVCQMLKFTCPLMVTQNDGSLIEIERAINYPVLTISAGPTNSFIGGSKLAELNNAIVVDIGGTSTDVGLVRKGFPLRSLNKSNIGGVSLNFPMPDVLSIALGGGSEISFYNGGVVIGPKSVAKTIETEAMSFGGNVLTLTDVALSMGHLEIHHADPKRIFSLSSDQSKMILNQVRDKIQHLVVKMQGEYKDLPVILVGGGSSLIPQKQLGNNYFTPKFFNVANAYGAALAEISGCVDAIVSLQKRDEVLDNLYQEAKQKAITQGADPKTLRLIDQQIIPYHYIPNQMARVIVRFCGKKC